MKHGIFLFLLLVASTGANAREDTLKLGNATIILDTTGTRKTPLFLEDLALIGMTFTPSEEYSVPGNINLVPFCDEKECPLWRLGLVHAILTRRDGQCKIAVYVGGAYEVRYGRILRNNSLTGQTRMTRYNRVKFDLNYGKPHAAPSKQDEEDLKMMMTFYPADTARALCNADEMLAYPFDMKGQAIDSIFTRTRVVVASKNGLEIYFYFMLTDQGVGHFDKYLSSLQDMFRFNNNTTRIDGK
jgi:hypothetical protein